MSQWTIVNIFETKEKTENFIKSIESLSKSIENIKNQTEILDLNGWAQKQNGGQRKESVNWKIEE